MCVTLRATGPALLNKPGSISTDAHKGKASAGVTLHKQAAEAGFEQANVHMPVQRRFRHHNGPLPYLVFIFNAYSMRWLLMDHLIQQNILLHKSQKSTMLPVRCDQSSPQPCGSASHSFCPDISSQGSLRIWNLRSQIMLELLSGTLLATLFITRTHARTHARARSRTHAHAHARARVHTHTSTPARQQTCSW